MASDEWRRLKRWRRQDQARGRYAPRLWPVWPVAIGAIVAASALAWVIYLQLRVFAVPHAAPDGGPASRDPLDVIKTTITVAGFVGAVLVGVYAYRKQRLAEGDAHRTDAEQLAERYTTAADQLGHEKAAVRLAGVYAMARLADDWDEAEQRQVCIDVLCAYLRMPYETDTISEKYREGEREVRHAVIRVIRDHLRDPGAPTTWCGCNLDFTNATFDGGDFTGAKFTGGEVSFADAEFTGGEVSFRDAIFTDSAISLRDAESLQELGDPILPDGLGFAEAFAATIERQAVALSVNPRLPAHDVRGSRRRGSRRTAAGLGGSTSSADRSGHRATGPDRGIPRGSRATRAASSPGWG